jgi:thymidylate synthase (FAD)
MGMAKEQAREILPLCTYTSWIWTASLAAVAHFIKLRDEEHAQFEIREYAKAMRTLTEPLFPMSLAALEQTQ